MGIRQIGAVVGQRVAKTVRKAGDYFVDSPNLQRGVKAVEVVASEGIKYAGVYAVTKDPTIAALVCSSPARILPDFVEQALRFVPVAICKNKEGSIGYRLKDRLIIGNPLNTWTQGMAIFDATDPAYFGKPYGAIEHYLDGAIKIFKHPYVKRVKD